MAADLGFEIFTSIRFDPHLLDVASTPRSSIGQALVKHGPLYILDLHRNRLVKAASHWGWHQVAEELGGPAGLTSLRDKILAAVGRSQQSPLKVKVAISEEGVVSCSSSPFAETSWANLFPARLPAPGGEGRANEEEQRPHDSLLPSTASEYQVLVDSAQTTPSELTHFKTTARAAYDAARKRARVGLKDAKEVLLVNTDGCVMEGSLTTPYFWRGGRWVTPRVSLEYGSGAGCGGQDGTTRRWALESHLVVEDVVPAQSLVDGEPCWLSNGARGFLFGRVWLA